MLKPSYLLYLLLIVSGFIPATRLNRLPTPVSIIFDTDMGPDYDDVGALAMLHAFSDSGKVNLLATIASDKHPRVAAVLDVLNTYFGRPDLPVGVPKGDAVNLGATQKWDSMLVARYPHDLLSNEQATDAVKLYRKILSQQPDKSVTIVSVGFFTNLSNLLASPGDAFSPLNGLALVKKKVKHLVSMAGWFPEGKEFNVEQDVKASLQVVNHWPTPILFSGFEIGSRVFTGLPLLKSNLAHSPVKDVFSWCIPLSEEDKNGRMSWDETAVLVAVQGWKPNFALRTGTFICKEDGSNGWNPKGDLHSYLIEKKPARLVEKEINALLLHQPRSDK